MTIWSSFILDEMAGLRKDALPTCTECRSDKEFLAKNTGIVSALSGPDAAVRRSMARSPRWTITDGATAARPRTSCST